jgi:hypothetical protein
MFDNKRKVLGVAGSCNLQARFGEDVISRMIYACGMTEGLERHKDPAAGGLLSNTVNRMIKRDKEASP